MNQERVFQVLLGPHVSEKAAIVADMNNQYVFRLRSTRPSWKSRRPSSSCSRSTSTDVQTLKVKGKVKRNRFGLSKKPQLEERHMYDWSKVRTLTLPWLSEESV